MDGQLKLCHSDQLAPLDVVFLHDIVNHERARLAHDRWLNPRTALDGPDHRAVPRPFLKETGFERGDIIAAALNVDWLEICARNRIRLR